MGRHAMAPCLVCGKQLENADETAINQPYDANSFHSEGAYGSTLFDPMNGEFLEINLCSECMKSAAKDGRILIARSAKPVLIQGVLIGAWTRAHREYTPWNPENEDDTKGLDIDTWEDWENCKDDIEISGTQKQVAEKLEYIKKILTQENQ